MGDRGAYTEGVGIWGLEAPFDNIPVLSVTNCSLNSFYTPNSCYFQLNYSRLRFVILTTDTWRVKHCIIILIININEIAHLQ